MRPLGLTAWQTESTMKKRTLRFPSLVELCAFTRQVDNGYLINTNNLTITAHFPEDQLLMATTAYNAIVIDTNEKVFSYDPL